VAENNGFTEGYRPRFPITIQPILEKLSRRENRSVNNFILRSTLKSILRSEFERNLDTYIDELIQNGEKSQLLKCE